MSSVLGWVLNFVLLMVALFDIAFQLMWLVELEGDYINPFDLAYYINIAVPVEYILHGVICISLLLTGHWFFCLMCLPYLFCNVRLYLRGQHLVDVTEIYNQLRGEKKLRIFKFVYLGVIVFIFLSWMIWAITEDFSYD